MMLNNNNLNQMKINLVIIVKNLRMKVKYLTRNLLKIKMNPIKKMVNYQITFR
jgi:hypothetical protein